MGDWTNHKDPVNIQTWTPLARKMVRSEQEAAEELRLKWEALQPKLKEARGKRGIFEIPDAGAIEYLKVVSYLRTKLSVPVAPAMPSVQSFFASNLEDKGQPEPKDALIPKQH